VVVLWVWFMDGLVVEEDHEGVGIIVVLVEFVYLGVV